ncbi:MAG: DnaT-like ssDNA-binding domain-containing protein [Halopseudomonas sp.]
MSSLFPEQPILFYPSLAGRFGVEQALLLTIYHQYGCHHGALDAQGAAQFILRRREWLALTPFFDEEKLAQLTNSLVGQRVLDAEFQANGSIRITLLEPDLQAKSVPGDQAVPALAEHPIESATSPADALLPPPHNVPSVSNSRYPPMAVSESVYGQTSQNLMVRGPAPSFGGSTGWTKPKDDLERLFEKQERHNQRLKEITPNWQPQQTTLDMLAKRNVTHEFALACVDQFVAYYMGKEQRKTSWEQPFMKWVDRDWVDAQKKQNREQANNAQQGFSGERDQTGSRQRKRERITKSVMDIHNTDW